MPGQKNAVTTITDIISAGKNGMPRTYSFASRYAPLARIGSAGKKRTPENRPAKTRMWWFRFPPRFGQEDRRRFTGRQIVWRDRQREIVWFYRARNWVRRSCIIGGQRSLFRRHDATSAQ